MKVNYETKDYRETTLESWPRGSGWCNSSMSNLDNFELTKDKTRVEWSSALSIVEFSATKELVKMKKKISTLIQKVKEKRLYPQRSV